MMHALQPRNTSPPQIPMLPHVPILQIATSPDNFKVVAFRLQILLDARVDVQYLIRFFVRPAV